MSNKRIIVDVREPFEYKTGHVEGSINIPPAELLSGKSPLSSVDKDTEVIVYCRSGSRSNSSIQIMRQMGFTNLINGINANVVKQKYL